MVTMNRPEAKNALFPCSLASSTPGTNRRQRRHSLRVLTGAGGTSARGWTSSPWRRRAAEPYRTEQEAAPDLHWKALLRHYQSQAAHRRGRGIGRGRRNGDPPGHRHPGGGRGSQVRRLRGPAGAVPPRRLDRAAAPPDPLHRGHGPPPHGAGGQRRGGSGDRPHRAGRPRRPGPDEAMAIAEVISANGPLAVEAIKRSVRETEGISESEALKIELEIGWPIFATDDAKEGRGRSPRSAHPTTSVGDPGGEPGVSDFGISSGGPRPGDPPVGADERQRRPALRPGRRGASGHRPPWSGPTSRRRPRGPPPPAVEAVADALDAAPVPDGGPGPARPGGAPPGLLPTSPVIGFANPVAPPVVVEAVDGGAGGTATSTTSTRGRPPASTAGSSP